MSEQLPTVETVSSIIMNIDALIGVSTAGLTRSRQEFFAFEGMDALRYEELWQDINRSLASFRTAGFYFANPNRHQRLNAMRGFLCQSDGTIGEIRRIPRQLYSDLRRSLEILREALRDAYAPIEIQRELRDVILTCREDHDPRRNPNPPVKVHFDVDQLKITWWTSENPQAGQKELESRLRILIEELRLQNRTTESASIEGVIDDAR